MTTSSPKSRYVASRRERPAGNRVLVGLALGPDVPSQIALNWLALQMPSDRILSVEGAYIQQAHNEIVRQAFQRLDWEILLFLEHDHPLPPNLLERVASYQEDVTGAMYWLRRPPHHCCAMVPKAEHDDAETWAGEWGGRLEYLGPVRQIAWLQEGKLQRVCAVGMGCTAIHRRVLEAFPAGELPFQTPYQPDGELITDDVHFCKRAAELGFEVWLDCGMPLEHLSRRPVGLHEHLATLEARGRELGLV
jgi:hypothetical protein